MVAWKGEGESRFPRLNRCRAMIGVESVEESMRRRAAAVADSERIFEALRAPVSD